MSSRRAAPANGSVDPRALAPTDVAPSGVRDTGEARDDEAIDAAEASRARIGTIVDGYRLDAILGVGGTATVYRGVREDGRRAALKMLHGWLNADPRAKKRFLREATVANQLKHPAIVRMLSEGEDADGTAFLVMELAEGRTLEAHRVESGGRVGLDEVARFADDLLGILSVAHAQGIVHRDIKPANVLITPEGRLRVLDFGIARVTELSDTPSLVTRTGAVLGTVFFMAPEQALGVRDDIDARSDVWAVGATMFTLLSGQFVHRARTVNEALVLAATQPAPPVSRVCEGLPRPVAAVINRALSFDRGNRYKDATAMRAALARAMAGDADEEAAATADTLPEIATLPERSALPARKPEKAKGGPRVVTGVAVGAAIALGVIGLTFVPGLLAEEPLASGTEVVSRPPGTMTSASATQGPSAPPSTAPTGGIDGGAPSALPSVSATPRSTAKPSAAGSVRAPGAGSVKVPAPPTAKPEAPNPPASDVPVPPF